MFVALLVQSSFLSAAKTKSAILILPNQTVAPQKRHLRRLRVSSPVKSGSCYTQEQCSSSSVWVFLDIVCFSRTQWSTLVCTLSHGGCPSDVEVEDFKLHTSAAEEFPKRVMIAPSTALGRRTYRRKQLLLWVGGHRYLVSLVPMKKCISPWIES